MSQESVVAQEQSKLQEERAQIGEELNHLRELMQAEVDVEPDEGDSEAVSYTHLDVYKRQQLLLCLLQQRVFPPWTGNLSWVTTHGAREWDEKLPFSVQRCHPLTWPKRS